MNKLVAKKMNIDDQMQASLLNSSSPDSWETLVVIVSYSTPNGILTMESVKDSLLNEKARRKEKGESSFGVLVHERQEKLERHERSQSRNPHGFRGRSKYRKNIKFYHRNKVGHMKKECRIWKKEHNKMKKENKETNIIATERDIMIVTDDGCVSLATQDGNLVIDSGSSFHVTYHCDFFTSYRIGDFRNVRMGNRGVSKIVGIVDICLDTSIGNKLVLKDIRHVLDIHLNLISASRLDDEGFANSIGESKWKLTKGSLVVARGKKQKTLYVMKAKLHKEEINATQQDVSIELWHRRLGHICEKGLQTLARKQFLPNLQGIPLKTCDHCLVGKENRLHFTQIHHLEGQMLLI